MDAEKKITDFFTRLDKSQKKALNKLGIKTVLDLLYHFPSRYGDTAKVQNIDSLNVGENAIIFGHISKLKTSKAYVKKIPMSEGYITDDSGHIKCIWFNQAYIAKMYKDGDQVKAEGKVSERRGEKYLSNPKLEKVTKLPLAVGDSLFSHDEGKNLYPVYPESLGISSRWIYFSLQKIFKSGILDNLEDPIPSEILDKYNLPSLKTALYWIHNPKNENDASVARKRFAFEEVFLIQLDRQQSKLEYQKNPSFLIETSKKDIEEFVERFPFSPTQSQINSIDTIVDDFKKGHAMSRLLEGDVGSGKTAVAATTAYSVITTRPKGQKFGRLQVAYMCPTEILATQHFESFIQYFSYLNIQIGLITSSGCRKFPSKLNPKGWTDISRTQLLKWVENGEIPILIGTHSLIQKTVKFKNLAYVIIDEQHRFGTAQRSKLVKKDEDNLYRAPHLLSMTATPIPRTLALTVFGDLDLTLLDEMPHGRKRVITKIVKEKKLIEMNEKVVDLEEEKVIAVKNTKKEENLQKNSEQIFINREDAYEKIREELRAGKQAYIICPRIDEPDPDKEVTVNAKSVIEEAKRLKKDVFPEYNIGILHGKMKPDDKDKAMIDFKNKKTNILCATSVIEVGVNVPNATVIIIEGGERFGLAQLHQLRGRVIRSNDQAYCFVFTESWSKKTADRLKAFTNAKNGFELAEYDLQFRGAGDLYGVRQWGISDIAMDALKNVKMIEAARAESQKLLSEDANLTHYPTLKYRIKLLKKDLHFE